ncbi:MerR family transcriptional regulator [Virgibacillus pantothenticus]|uniref:MerR family transcriptional regulator n=1 Tax=Virgibacillus pantothenticus TaxID=1473 RepID=UPI000985BD30|nr:helix-turn-helix domain-containing protein [Virgibacillus pantothenticus]GIP63461.1 MerR family transcriptional regulator [Virgibacillus pantothenticus]
MKDLFSIGEVADIKGVTIKALRYYHQEGILIPAYIDKESGFRYYSIDQFIHIDIIKACRILGTSIKELKQIFMESNTNNLLKFLAFKKEETELKMKKMKEVIETIDKLNDSVQFAKMVLVNNQITVQYFKKRYVVTAPCKEVGDLKEVLYYSDLDKIIQEKNVETTMESGIVYNINSKGSLEPSYVFSVLNDNDGIQIEQNIDILPEGKYVTIAYSKENEEESMTKLHNYIEENNLKINNFIEVELLDDIFNTDSYSCQIQLLIGDDGEC